MASTSYESSVQLGSSAERIDPPPGGYQVGDRYFERDTGLHFVVGIDPLTGFLVWEPDSDEVNDKPLAIFLSPTGNDKANGLTPATAIQTINELAKRTPPLNASTLHAVFLPGTYAAPDNPFLAPIAVNPAGEEMVWEAQSFDLVQGPLTVTAPSPTGVTLTVAGGLTPGALRGLFIQYLSGDNSKPRQQWAQVRSNTATTITLLDALPHGISTGDTFQVMRSNVFIDGTNNEINFQGELGDGGQIGFVGLTFVGQGFLGINAQFDRCALQTQGNTWVVQGGARIDTGAVNAFSVYGTFVPPVKSAGIYISGTDGSSGSSLTVTQFSRGFMKIVADDCLVRTSRGAMLQVTRIDGLRSALSFDTGVGEVFGSPAIFSSMHDLPPGASFNTETGPVTPSAALTAIDGAVVSMVQGLDLSNNAGDAILADGARLNEDLVTGTGNGGVGQHVQNGGYVEFVFGDTTVTGATGDVSLQGTLFAYGAIDLLPQKAVTDDRGNVVAEAA